MTNEKISDLTPLLGANVANGDELAIVDVSASETKKIAASELAIKMLEGVSTDIDNNLTVGTTISGTIGGSNTAAGSGVMQGLEATGGQPLQTATGNTGYGAFCLNDDNLSTDYCTGYGYKSLYSLTTGYCNTAGGIRSLESLTTGDYNTSWGCDALKGAVSVAESSAFGAKALLTGGGDYCVAIGSSSFYSATTGADDNIGVGQLSGYSTTTGEHNIYIGSRAGYSATTADDVVAVGHWALRLNTATGNTAVGADAAGSNTSGDGMVAVGENALSSNTTGAGSTATGYRAAFLNQTGARLTANGYQALYSATAGNNSAFGYQALYGVTTGTDNIGIGHQAEVLSNTGSNQIAIKAGTTNWMCGAGTPEGAVTAGVGSLFTRTDGGASTTLYVKESGAGNTGWVAK